MKFPRFMAMLLMCSDTAYSQLNTGVEVIIPNQALCVHSELHLNGPLINTSNIYILRGTGDTVWIFGCGYGDTTDLNVYRDTTLVTSLQQDLHLTDSIINSFGILNPKVMVLVAHGHLDHINFEFVNGLDSLFGFMQSWIYVHLADKFKSTCNSLCCGTTPCIIGNICFGAPFSQPWSQPMLTRFKTIGNKNLTCGVSLKQITTSYGNWVVKKADTAHTAGAINLEHPALQYRINGADILSSCLPPLGWLAFPIHGNCF